MIRLAQLIVVGGVGIRVCDQGSERAEFAGAVRLPVQAVLLAGYADDLLRIFKHLVAVAVGLSILQLRVDIRAQEADGAQLVAADPAVVDLLDAGLRVEAPALVLMGQRHRHRPVLPAHDHGHRAVRVGLEFRPRVASRSSWSSHWRA